MYIFFGIIFILVGIALIIIDVNNEDYLKNNPFQPRSSAIIFIFHLICLGVVLIFVPPLYEEKEKRPVKSSSIEIEVKKGINGVDTVYYYNTKDSTKVLYQKTIERRIELR